MTTSTYPPRAIHLEISPDTPPKTTCLYTYAYTDIDI